MRFEPFAKLLRLRLRARVVELSYISHELKEDVASPENIRVIGRVLHIGIVRIRYICVGTMSSGAKWYNL